MAKHAAYEICAIIEDTRASNLGSINIGFTLWQQTIEKMLLHNCETFVNIPKKTMKILNGVYNLFYRTLFRIGTGTPIKDFY